jgi:hypothetical protein
VSRRSALFRARGAFAICHRFVIPSFRSAEVFSMDYAFRASLQSFSLAVTAGTDSKEDLPDEICFAMIGRRFAQLDDIA